MSWSITVEDPDGLLVEVNEPIISICDSPGSLVCCVQELGFETLDKLNSTESMIALQKLVREIDKGNKGVFSDEKCFFFDEKWSDGKESKSEYEKWIPALGTKRPEERKRFFGFDDHKSFCAWQWRKNTRETAVRFYLYIRAGYEIKYEW